MKRKMTFFALPAVRGIFAATAADAEVVALNNGCRINAARATAPNPQPAVRRNSRREFGRSKLWQGMATKASVQIKKLVRVEQHMAQIGHGSRPPVRTF